MHLSSADINCTDITNSCTNCNIEKNVCIFFKSPSSPQSFRINKSYRTTILAVCVLNTPAYVKHKRRIIQEMVWFYFILLSFFRLIFIHSRPQIYYHVFYSGSSLCIFIGRYDVALLHEKKESGLGSATACIQNRQ